MIVDEELEVVKTCLICGKKYIGNCDCKIEDYIIRIGTLTLNGDKND